MKPGEPLRPLRADLHVHSYHSGYTGHFQFLRTRDCYSSPEAVYRVAKSRGMDLVTITDHDSIDGCLEFLTRHPDAPDFIMGEEIECTFPDAPLKVHIGVYGITERIHRDIQPLRPNVFEAVEYLRQQNVLFVLNHLFHFYHGQIDLARYLRDFVCLMPALEIQNGTMLPRHNQLIAEIAHQLGRERGQAFIGVGGSDSHTLRGIGSTYTEAAGPTREAFLANIRAGACTTGGQQGSTRRVAREIYGVIGNHVLAILGLGRHELTLARRAVGFGFGIVSLPIQVYPLIAAFMEKRSEAHRVDRWSREWGAQDRSRQYASLAAYPVRGEGIE